MKRVGVSRDLMGRLEHSGYSVPGFAERYDAVRPRPPSVLLEWLPRLAGAEHPSLVVDLGSGTGHSARVWADCAREVVGVEPNAAMRRFAERVTSAPNVRYVAGSGEMVPLPDGCADLITCSQSLQWMEPDATFREVCRILRAGGVLAAYQYKSLTTPHWEPEAAWSELLERKARLRRERGLDRGSRRWPPSPERLEAAGCLEHVRELTLHSVEAGDAERLVSLARSEGSLATLLDDGVTESEVGLDRLREIAERTIGAVPCPWLIGYQVWIGRRR